MATYRAYVIRFDERFIGTHILDKCANDTEAIEAAKALLKGYDLEIWHGVRFVIRLDHRENK